MATEGIRRMTQRRCEALMSDNVWRLRSSLLSTKAHGAAMNAEREGRARLRRRTRPRLVDIVAADVECRDG